MPLVFETLFSVQMWLFPPVGSTFHNLSYKDFIFPPYPTHFLSSASTHLLFKSPLTGIMEQLSASHLYGLVVGVCGVCVCDFFCKDSVCSTWEDTLTLAVLPLLGRLHNSSCSEVVVLPLFLLPSSLPFTPPYCPLPLLHYHHHQQQHKCYLFCRWPRT